MTDSFDVRSANIPIVGTPGTGFVPLIHFPSSGGAITLLEAQLNNGTGGVPNTLWLVYGTVPTASGTYGTFIPKGTIGTAIGSSGSFGAATLFPIALGTAVVPADYWLAIQCAGTFNCAAQSVVTLAYVQGR